MRTRKASGKAEAKIAALVANLRGVVRLNPNDFNASHLSFVLDEALQLEEAPVANPVIHPFASVSFPYSFEVLHHYLVSIKSGDNLFADVVINPSHITSFPSTKLPEKTLGGLCAFGLKNRTQMPEPSLGLLNSVGVEELAVRSDCQVVNSEVNAKNNTLRAIVLFRGINLFGEREQEESPAFSVNPQEAFLGLTPSKVSFVTRRNVEAEFLPCLEQSQSQLPALDVGTSGEVIAYGSPLNYGFGFGFFDHSASLFDAGYGELCWQGLSQTLINERLEFDIVPDFSLPSLVHAELQSFGVGFDCGENLLRWVNSDFGCDNRSHIGSVQSQVFKLFGGEVPNSSHS